MAFTASFEIKFRTINRTPAKTEVAFIIYQVTDGGLDSGGRQLYTRSNWRRGIETLDAGWDDRRITAYYLQRLKDYRTQNSLPYADANLICTL
jgi:hypothetical protein